VVLLFDFQTKREYTWVLNIAYWALVLGVLYLYRRYGIRYLLQFDEQQLTITNLLLKTSKTIQYADIALIIHDWAIEQRPKGEKISVRYLIVFSKTGKVVFTCNFNHQETAFFDFFRNMRDKINAVEQKIYAAKIYSFIPTIRYRFFYINPLHRNSAVVRRKSRQGKLLYPIWVFLLVIAIFVALLQIIVIYFPGVIP
jgi:hypothetical protein